MRMGSREKHAFFDLDVIIPMRFQDATAWGRRKQAPLSRRDNPKIARRFIAGCRLEWPESRRTTESLPTEPPGGSAPAPGAAADALVRRRERVSARSFQGIIALHTDDTSDGSYGIVRGATLTKHLIEPALRAAEPFLPRDRRAVIDGFNARNGVIRDCYDGVLSAPPRAARPKPFEIILETPRTPPEYVKVCGLVLALQTILVEYQKFIACAQNI